MVSDTKRDTFGSLQRNLWFSWVCVRQCVSDSMNTLSRLVEETEIISKSVW